MNILSEFKITPPSGASCDGLAATLRIDEPVLEVACLSNSPITLQTIIQNGDWTWKRSALGDPIQVPHGQPAGYEHTHHRQGSDCFSTFYLNGGELREKSAGNTICAFVLIFLNSQMHVLIVYWLTYSSRNNME